MAYDGSGNYSLPPGSIVSDGTTIDAADHNVPVTDIAAAMSQVLLRSGVAPMTGNLNMGGFAIVNMGGSNPVLTGDNIWTGANTWSGTNIMTTATSSAIPLELISTNSDALVGPVLSLYRNSADPADTDIGGSIQFNGKTSAGNKATYAGITVLFKDITNPTEDGELHFSTVTAGSVPGTRMVIGDGVYHPSVAGGDKGNNTINFGTVYQNGSAVGPLGGDNTWSAHQGITYAVGSSPPNYMFSIKATDKTAPFATWNSTVFYDGSNQVAGIISHTSSGSSTTGTTVYGGSSDGRLKPERFRRPIANSGDIIDRLNPIYFQWGETGREDFGLVAQEVHAILPPAAVPGKGDPGDQDFVPWQMQHGRLEAVLIAEIKALRARVAALEAALP